ncbi:hypothetical protein QYE76_044528 [Lolium multiflorum]|uniref:Uncharacterized protein n=1 Tax=Lolium multiflorum TaxID=4521 RepID=A0AAD8TJD0_LOLMU|nr:hypothetical protein QYE76_044528 [Lolium multiflorum]
MENYSLLMETSALMKMAVVSMEKPSGGTSPSGGLPEQRLCPPDLGFAMAAALEDLGASNLVVDVCPKNFVKARFPPRGNPLVEVG